MMGSKIIIGIISFLSLWGVVAQNSHSPIFLINTDDTSTARILSSHKEFIERVQEKHFILAGCKATFEILNFGDSVSIRRLNRPVYRDQLLASAKRTATVSERRKIKWCGYTFNFNPRNGSCLITSKDISTLLAKKPESCKQRPLTLTLTQSKIPIRIKHFELKPFVFNRGSLCGVGTTCEGHSYQDIVSKIISSTQPNFIHIGLNHVVSVYDDSIAIFNHSGKLRKINLRETLNDNWILIKPLWMGFLENKELFLIAGVSMLTDSSYQLWALWLKDGYITSMRAVPIKAVPPMFLSVYDGSETGIVVSSDTNLTFVYIEPFANEAIILNPNEIKKVIYNGFPFKQNTKPIPLKDLYNKYVNTTTRNVLAFYKADTLIVIGQIPDFSSYPVGGDNAFFVRLYLTNYEVAKQDTTGDYLCLYKLSTSEAVKHPENWITFHYKFINSEGIEILSGESILKNKNKSFIKFILKQIKTFDSENTTKEAYLLKIKL